ncbi:MurR/RpiR family transcriptional regulator [Olsenella sp. kh2p3]|uniref:MurR/RpiR family transcriptional regulator n=1 Tax=Olsenella sp. kh2p3 TaxID=1797112 RepID=UPI0009164059|nr:MurR/RpiR family transcriptional regulator [Olsenella sp. kh2p3]SFX49074.1 transcriptional regulator, RpiR family [Olsenella sp. kh2p3]
MPVHNSSVLLKIKAAMPSFSSKEREIAEYVIANPDDASLMTISEIASTLGLADSTVFKFTKKLGYQGYRDFRNDLLTDAYNPEISVHENVSRDDSAIDIAKKVFRSSVMSLEDTAKLFDADDLDKAVQLLLDARRVSFYGSGESNAVAYDAYQKFLRSPIEVQFAADYHVQLMQASLLGKEDCIFAITHTGLSEGIINIARIAKDAGAKVIAVASYPSKYLEQYADVILLSASEETGYRSESLSSRIAQLALIDSLYTTVMFRKPGVPESLHAIRSAISLTKLDNPENYMSQL